MRGIIRNNLYMLKLLSKYSPKRICIAIFASLVDSVVSVANIFLMKYILDSLIDTKAYSTCVMYIFILAITNILVLIIGSYLYSYLIPRTNLIIGRKIQSDIFLKASELHYELYDDTEFYNQFNLAISQGPSRLLSVLDTFVQTLSTIFEIGAFITLIFQLKPILLVFSAVGSIIAIISNNFSTQFRYASTVESIPLQRHHGYIQRIFYLRGYAQEIRVFSEAKNFLLSRYCEAQNSLLELLRKYAIKIGAMQICSEGASVCDSLSSMLYLALSIYRGEVTAGTFVALSNSSVELYEQICGFAGLFNKLYENNLYITNYLDFMNLKSGNVINGIDIIEQPCIISFKNVTFGYNGSSPIIKNATFEIKKGDKILIRGDNGAGKSTLIKLLLRLYRVSSGEILLDGINIEKINSSSYNKLYAIVFQDFQLFEYSIAENILMHPITNSIEEISSIWKALETVGLAQKVRELPDGINTFIGRELSDNGIILSGGEKQRLAIARALVQNHPIIILDEATSALDDETEKSIYTSIFENYNDRTVLIVSHHNRNIRTNCVFVDISDGYIMLERHDIY